MGYFSAKFCVFDYNEQTFSTKTFPDRLNLHRETDVFVFATKPSW